MTAERRPASAAPLEQRPKIGDEPIVAGHQLVELTARGDVLILERLRLARLRWSQHRLHHFVIYCGELARLPGKKREIVANPWAIVVADEGRNSRAGSRASAGS